MWDFECPVCKGETVPANGSKKSPVLIIGDAPGTDEMKEGKPFVGPTGGILRSELGRRKIDMNRIRMTNLWHHPPNQNPDCLDYSTRQAIAEGANKRVILLVGSETVKFFAGVSVAEWNGLEVQSVYFPHARLVACMQIASAFHGGIGELVFALDSFADVLKQEKLL